MKDFTEEWRNRLDQVSLILKTAEASMTERSYACPFEFEEFSWQRVSHKRIWRICWMGIPIQEAPGRMRIKLAKRLPEFIAAGETAMAQLLE